MTEIYFKILNPYSYGLVFMIYGFYSIFLALRFKHGRAEKKWGRVVNTRTITLGKRIKAPVVKFEHDGFMYKTVGFTNTITPIYDEYVDIYYDEKKYPNFVFIDNGYKDYIQGLLLLLIGIPFVVGSILVCIYCYSDNEFALGIYMRKLEFYLPKLMPLLIWTIFIIILSLKVDGFGIKKYSETEPILADKDPHTGESKKRPYTEKMFEADMAYFRKHGEQRPGRIEPQVFVDSDPINKEDRMMIYMFLKEGQKQDAIDYYMEKTGESLLDATAVVEEYEQFL